MKEGAKYVVVAIQNVVNMTRTELKKLSKEEFMKLPGATEDLYIAVQNAKSGYIEVTHATQKHFHKGYTEAFGEGIGCYMATPHEWYTTSVIKNINWEEKYFDTLNSRYYFKFKEDDFEKND
jgi:hypothetical protein